MNLSPIFETFLYLSIVNLGPVFETLILSSLCGLEWCL